MTPNDDFQQHDETFWEQADEAVRENPIPAVLTAVVIGFGLGLLVRALEPDDHPRSVRDSMRDYLDDGSDAVQSMFRPLAKRTRRAGGAVRDAVGNALHRVHDTVEDIDVDPVAKWWRRLWS